MTMARPPHYVDKIEGGFTSYDAYDQMNYVLACGEDEYVARYVVRVKRQSA